MDKAEIIRGLMLAADAWALSAPPEQLLRVLLRGGLSARIAREARGITTTIGLSDRKDGLSGIGILHADLHPDEALALYAHAWDASEPPAASGAQEAWLAADAVALQCARQHLRAEIEESARLFEQVVDAWLTRAEPTSNSAGTSPTTRP
mgnify:CR=1 FL=1